MGLLAFVVIFYLMATTLRSLLTAIGVFFSSMSGVSFYSRISEDTGIGVVLKLAEVCKDLTGYLCYV